MILFAAFAAVLLSPFWLLWLIVRGVCEFIEYHTNEGEPDGRIQ